MIAIKLRDAVTNLRALAGRVPADVWDELRGIALEVESVVEPVFGLESGAILAAPAFAPKPEAVLPNAGGARGGRNVQ